MDFILIFCIKNLLYNILSIESVNLGILQLVVAKLTHFGKSFVSTLEENERSKKFYGFFPNYANIFLICKLYTHVTKGLLTGEFN